MEVSVLLGAIITLFGMFVFNAFMIFPKAKSFKEISINKWWEETQIRFVMACLIITIVFYMSWYYGTLTVEHCFYLGIVGNLIVDSIIKANAKSK